MNATLYALRDLAEPGVNLQWFEAVAVVLGMTESWPGNTSVVPPFDAFTITNDGTIRPLPGTRPTGTAPRELGLALQCLLVDPGAPQALRDLARNAAQSGPDAVAAPHLSALAYFERPDRARILVFLAQRVVPELPEVNVEEELRRLEARARERAENEKPPGPWERFRTWLRPHWQYWRSLVPAAVLTLLVAGAAATLYSSPVLRAAVITPVSQVARWIRPGPAPEVPAVGPATAEPTTREGAAPRHAPSPGAGGRPREQPGVPDVSASPPVEASVDHREPAAEPMPLLPPIRDIQVSAPPGNPGVRDIEGIGLVYRDGDPGVVPARLGRNYLPESSPQGVAPEQAGAFELIVDEQGRVARVRLLSLSNRYQERMLLSAAKAWQFSPALKDGVPVKFLTQVRVTW